MSGSRRSHCLDFPQKLCRLGKEARSGASSSARMLRSRRVKMSVEEFHRQPFRLGWKLEYLRGHLVETPRQVMAYATIPVAPRPAIAPVALRLAVPTDEQVLLPCFVAAFRNAFEFCDYGRDQFVKAARECLRYVFSQPNSRWAPASLVALGAPGTRQAGKPIGAALVLLQTDCAFLDAVFVAPSFQRRGLATALVTASINALFKLSSYRRLVSRYLVGNEPSRAWHRRFGFKEEPDLQLAQLYARAASRELVRLRELGERSLDRQSQLEADCAHWQAEVSRLEALLDEGRESEAYSWHKWKLSEGSD